MQKNLDDFEDDYEYIRLKHLEACGIEPYGDLYFLYEPDFEGLLQHATKHPTYDLSTKPINDARSFFNGLGNLGDYKGFNKLDKPEDLYHPNNKVLLDPESMPSSPIDPDQFISKVVPELQSRGVLVTDKVKNVLSLMCRLFNFSIAPNYPIPHGLSNLVFPAQTGIGKSVSLQVYVSMLERHSSIIIVPKVQEAIKYCENINNLSGTPDYARCFYAVTKKNPDSELRVESRDLCKYRCIVITHNMFFNLNKEESIESFSMFNGSLREFVSIDEKLALYEKHAIGLRQLSQITSGLEMALQNSALLRSISTSNEALEAIKKFENYLRSRAELLIKDDQSIVVSNDIGLGTTLDKILSAINECLQYADQRKNFPKKLVGLNDKAAVIDALEKNNIRYQDTKRTVIGCSFTEHVKQFQNDLVHIDEFFCSRIEPPIANCQSSAQDGNERSLEMMGYMNLPGSQPSSETYESPMGVATLVAKIILKERVKEIFEELKSYGAVSNPLFESKALSQMNELLNKIHILADGHALLHKTNYETTYLTTQNITNQLGLSVVLDATAQINEYYQLANRFLGHVGFVPAPQIRQYSNLVIHKARGYNQSRSAIYRTKSTEEIEAIARTYASYALNELADEKDKMLIVSHKDFSGFLKKNIGDPRVVFTHWGNHIGRNDWSDCNKVMLIGWNYLGPVEHLCAINSSLDSVLLTSRHLDDSLIDKFETSQLADDIIQALMRSQARVIATDDTDCKPTNFYLFYQDNQKDNTVLDIVESQFPQANIIDWKPNGAALPQKKTKRNKKDDEVISYLLDKAKNQQTVLRTDLQKDLSLSRVAISRIVRRDYFISKMAENGITYVDSDGKSHYFTLQ